MFSWLDFPKRIVRFTNKFVGIDVTAEFSMVAFLAPEGQVYRKSFRTKHTLDRFEYVASEIKKVEEKYDMEVAYFMESTGVYHISLFHFLNYK